MVNPGMEMQRENTMRKYHLTFKSNCYLELYDFAKDYRTLLYYLLILNPLYYSNLTFKII